MRSPINRKKPHFFIINPTLDRRIEDRFESTEPIEIRSEDSRAKGTGLAQEIGRTGLRMESSLHLDVGSRVQLVFPKTIDSIGCFGRIAWVHPGDPGKGFLCGVAIESWHGIVQGSDSWKRLKGMHPKHDRRQKLR